ncbi:uncharacterized protein LOC118193761 isoform X2 [Stegodyphus dumicola]|nr:uncharacterized protein LOC118193761 isoform X2 [Stegodyphus dumicola]
MKTFVSSVIDGTLAPKGPKSDIKIQSDLAAFSQDVQNVIDSDFQEQLSEGKSKRKQKGDLHEKYLSELLSADPDVIESLMPELRSQVVVLSDYLRASIWPACISYKEKPKQKKNSQKIHDRFVQLYIKQHLSQEFSKDSRTISSTVTKIYKETKGLKTLDSENNISSTVAILSVCDTYGKKFQPYYVFYAAVLQHVFLKSNQRTSDQEFGYAAMMLEKILRLCAVTNERSNKIVNKVIQILTDSDKELVNHIKQHLSSNLDGKTGSSTEKNISSSGSSQASDLRDSITFYLNKWITDAFSSVLKANCLFLVWDQLFLNKWENKIFQDVCLSLMGLLKPWFMLSKSKSDIEKVFLEEPSYLYMLDVRSALSFIQKKVNFSEIPSVNRNIKYWKQEPVKSPSPVQPPPPPPVVPVPARASTPPPKPVPSLPKFIPWVPYNKEKIKDTALVKSKVDMPFDLYIDSVRFVPDYATVVKVTGKVLNIYLGQKNKSIKFQGIPEMGSYWRHPKFKLKQTVNRESIPMNPDVVVMIRVYTLEQHSKQNYVLGSCLFGPFSNKHGKQATLRVGGHQVRVRHGIPDPDFTVEHMLASHMDDNPIIPGVTVLLRVLPHGKDYAPAPEYETNYYRSELAKPNDSENKLYKHYQDSKDLSAVVRDVALRQSGQASANDETLTQLMWQQLQKEGSDVEDFPYQRFVKYSMEHGIMVLIDKAAGLPLFLEGRYLQCLVQIFPGEDTKIGTGKNQVINFLTEELELDSPQRAPDWSDQPKRVTPEYDGRAFILISLYGLRPKFDTSSEKVLDKGGKDPKFNLQHAVAWGIATCFDKLV